MEYDNLWAPWRIEYLKSLETGEEENDRLTAEAKKEKCFFCRYWAEPDGDQENLVLWRTEQSLVVFNRFPYTAGHLLIAPAAHVGDLHALEEGQLLEMMLLTCDAQKALTEVIRPHGFNIGINVNRCAGAGLPDHIHLHLVPRWSGDTNFMTVTGNVRLVSQALEELYQQLTEISQQLKLPSIRR